MKKVICVLAIIGMLCAAPAAACDYEFGQWGDIEFGVELGDNAIEGNLSSSMGQWNNGYNHPYSQCQSLGGNVSFCDGPLDINLNYSGHQWSGNQGD